jgi:hypothetical protein
MFNSETQTEFVPVQQPAFQEPTEASSGLKFEVARNLEDILESWQLLYQSYLRAGFIKSNPYGLHTSHNAIGAHTTVIVGRRHGEVASTISAIVDTPLQLPLDSVYPDELAQLRSQGKKLVEIGLFGDDRLDVDRSFYALFELMRYATYYAYFAGATDIICGIPPRRARLYSKAFAFKPIGSQKSYSSVEGNPVVLLISNVDEGKQNHRFHRAIDYFVKNPLDPNTFDHRFQFRPEDMENSPLDGFLQHKS